ncbi:carbonic anhydrase 15-like [Coccinella septempunctata]|uniref:carbonic anhydrase 15-like n=1 Tax=Coccinella septempunctata TaxID=41139 RepID=UPI001D07AAF3|nr:carbonic anhydrase 15-like [Coccinella septempunctata]
MESPIDLYDDIIQHEEIEPLVIEDINKQIYAEIINTGEGITISVSSQNSPVIRGGGLPYPEYVVSQIIFRWDSEHTINKEKFAMEIQTLTIAKECRNFETALTKGGVAIFSTLYSLSRLENQGLNELLPIIPFISDEIGRVVPYDVMRLSHFFPENWNDFYRYNGSLTFPPFSTGVIWTIFKEKQPVTRPQMGLLCDIQDEDGNLIVWNNSASRNVKTVFYSSGKVKRKCQCPPGHRKHKMQVDGDEDKDKYDVEEIIKSQVYEVLQETPRKDGILKEETADLNDTIAKDTNVREDTNKDDKKKFEKVRIEGKEESLVREVDKTTQTEGEWESISLAARSYDLDPYHNAGHANKKISTSVSFKLSPTSGSGESGEHTNNE